MIKALIFDIGGVLLLPKNNGKEKNLLNSFNETLLLLGDFEVDTSSNMESLRDIYRKSSYGALTKEETLRQMSELLEVAPDNLEELFRKVYAENIFENEALYEKLLGFKKKGYKLGILSTQFHLSEDVLVPKKYYKDFDVLVISCDDKLKKPDEEAYTFTLKQLGVNAEESVFVDDQQKNVDVGKNLGMEAVLFQNNEQFFGELQELGIE